MALHWNIEKVKDHEALCYRENEEGYYLAAKTEALIWLCGSIGFTEITEKNYVEFATRMRIYQGLFGDVAGGIDLRDIRAHIGLRTNWGDETKTKWLNRMYKNGIHEVQLYADSITKEEQEEIEDDE